NNFIPENINYLTKKNNLSLDDFGSIFELSKGLTGQYVRKLSLPKIITIQKICAYYQISIDDFINTELSEAMPYALKGSQVVYTNEVSPVPYQVSPKYVEVLEKALEDKEKIIKNLESKLDIEIKSKTA
ncbi:hypothetical protein DNC80_15130, partial [Flavobacterium sp. SOK18b]|uniref:helix-turn-helix transcriptional regulator n=1 Tax=Flavobacterium sp. SOK18b TaxID=797900 RepID=UPI0015F8466C|nr:hypothetical protein [Flavobacterium sp. SOK18b]